jgi:geranylgeranyl pyrophosphate synthase
MFFFIITLLFQLNFNFYEIIADDNFIFIIDKQKIKSETINSIIKEQEKKNKEYQELLNELKSNKINEIWEYIRETNHIKIFENLLKKIENEYSNNLEIINDKLACYEKKKNIEKFNNYPNNIEFDLENESSNTQEEINDSI